MNIEKVIHSFEKKGYQVSFFETGADAVDYLKRTVAGRTIGFGGSRTLTDLRLQEVLSEQNTVLVPDFPAEGEDFRSTASAAMDADCYFLSANAATVNGELVNIDATGNRLAGSLYGHKKVYFVIGVNKLAESLDEAVHRARDVAGPKNAMRFHLKTPCALKGDKCYDCSSPQRICNALLIHFRRIKSTETEIVLINESYGF